MMKAMAPVRIDLEIWPFGRRRILVDIFSSARPVLDWPFSEGLVMLHCGSLAAVGLYSVR
jgi:hypothetical protein